MRDLMKIREAAEILDISQRQVGRLIDRGILPCVALGEKAKRIPRAKFEAWLAARIKDAESDQLRKAG